MSIKLIRIAMILLSLIGAVLISYAAESNACLSETMGAIGTMMAGIVGLGLSFCVTIKKGAKQ